MSNRLLRVNELLQREISAWLRKRYTAEATAITITGVEITGDLREAKVFYAVTGRDADAGRTGKWLRGRLREIREMIAKTVILRHVPLLTFHHDDHAPRAVRVEQLLEEIERKEGKP
ncbi:MAG: ribosome-binding factor A [Verrucomicrobiota bacterium]